MIQCRNIFNLVAMATVAVMFALGGCENPTEEEWDEVWELTRTTREGGITHLALSDSAATIIQAQFVSIGLSSEGIDQIMGGFYNEFSGQTTTDYDVSWSAVFGSDTTGVLNLGGDGSFDLTGTIPSIDLENILIGIDLKYEPIQLEGSWSEPVSDSLVFETEQMLLRGRKHIDSEDGVWDLTATQIDQSIDTIESQIIMPVDLGIMQIDLTFPISTQITSSLSFFFHKDIDAGEI